MNDMAAPGPWSEVSGQALMAHCTEFAKRVKLSGTPEELESFRYLKAQLDGFGYRTELLRHDAYISLPGPAHVGVDGAKLTAITHSFSRPSAAGGTRGRLVDMADGAGVAGGELAGCILLVDGIAGPAIAASASAAGAAGVIQVSPHEHLHEMCISPVWGSPSAETLPKLPSVVVTTISLADGTALRGRLAAGDAPDITLHAEVDTGWRKTPILVAELDAPGARPDAPFILFSGHHDTWYFGVMDNGSANATMLEVARVMAPQAPEFRRGLRLCFWSGHSHGRYSSSAWYADEHFAELARRCAVHVNIDSTGAVGAEVMTESATAAELAALARDVVTAETGEMHEGRRSSRNSDASFWGIGVPSMFGSLSHQPPEPVKMRNPLGWWWHTPHDLLDKIDEANLVRDTRIFARTIARLVCDSTLPIDHTAQATGLLQELDRLAKSLGDRFSLQTLMAAATALRHTPKNTSDHALIAASRALVPMEYTEGDRFLHDPALPLPPWPVLQPIRALAATTPGSDDALFQTRSAVRARNRLLAALDAAREALE